MFADALPYVSLTFTESVIYCTEMSKRPNPPLVHGERSSQRRSDNIESVRKTFARLKRIINSNYSDPESVRFLTLTYADNMQDNYQIRRDMDQFFRRFKKTVIDEFEYIYVKEQQARGAWHIHLILFFEKKAPFLANEFVSACWKLGFVNVKGFKGSINNLGNYLTAYLTDSKDDSKKGARLANYPSNIRLYSCSRGIKRPVRVTLYYSDYFFSHPELPDLKKEAITHFMNLSSFVCLSERFSTILSLSDRPVLLRSAIYELPRDYFTEYMLCKPKARGC